MKHDDTILSFEEEAELLSKVSWLIQQPDIHIVNGRATFMLPGIDSYIVCILRSNGQ